MRTEHTEPAARGRCENCGWTTDPHYRWDGAAGTNAVDSYGLNYSSRISPTRTATEQHARSTGHRVFYERLVGILYVGGAR